MTTWMYLAALLLHFALEAAEIDYDKPPRIRIVVNDSWSLTQDGFLCNYGAGPLTGQDLMQMSLNYDSDSGGIQTEIDHWNTYDCAWKTTAQGWSYGRKVWSSTYSPENPGTLTITTSENSNPVSQPAGSPGVGLISERSITPEYCNQMSIGYNVNNARNEWERYAITKSYLYTGGKATSTRMNLFSFSIGMSEALNARWLNGGPIGFNGPWWELAGGAPIIRPMNPALASFAGGAPDIDGRFFEAYSDNTGPIDVTPYDFSVNAYTYSVTPVKHRLKVQANDYGLSSDAPNQGYCVGQKLTFSSFFDPSLPVTFTKNNSLWNIDGDWVNTYTQSEGTTPSRSYYRDNAQLQNATCSIWHTTGGDSLRSQVGQNVTVSYIKSFSLVGQGYYRIHRPTISMQSVYPRAWNVTNKSIGGTYLQLGLDDGNNSMAFNVLINSQFDGSAMFTQLCQLDYNLWGFSFTDWRLDGRTEDYAGISSIRRGVPTYLFLNDIPRSPGSWPIRVKGNFKDYVRFQPSTQDSIWVTLGVVNWSVHGEIDYSPNPPGYRYTSQYSPDPVGPDTSNEFPIWQTNFHTP